MQISRKATSVIKVGDVLIGGSNPIAIQSMTNTKTKDVEKTVAQIKALEKVGVQIVRVACLDLEDATAIKEIKKQVRVPMVADIHFDYRLALAAAEAGVDKLRINPGNIGSIDRIKMVVDACKEKHIPIRIGINGGSLEKDLLLKYGGRTKEALVESAKRHVDILESMDFHDIAISIKTTDIEETLEANRLASATFPYPLHIGLTEAGSKMTGTIRSSYVLGTLLREGIGDTIRVSLTADPVEEVRAAKEILQMFGLYDKPQIISCPTCGRLSYDLFKVADAIEKYTEGMTKKVKIAIMGCVVNGPGEAREADFGIAGGNDVVVFFEKGEIVKKLKPDEAIEALKKAIDEFPN
jgi:(E)-4-hydroxy-3-methylbut-2-enyl-diphosphate synthase